MKHCIFGGSFDPPHEGHRRLARAAFADLGLDRLYWVPAQDPPHKAAPGTPFIHRLEMTRLAASGQAGYEVSDIESRLPSPSYSLNTIRALKAERGSPGDAWHFLVGADNWAIFPRWHRPEEVLREAGLVVYPREGFPLGPLPPGVRALDVDLVPGQSTAIRASLERGDSFGAAGVLPEIRAYIEAHGLYGRGRGV